MLGIENIIQIDVWDFAGQIIYYTTHQMYLSGRSVYFLVFNMSKPLNDSVQEEDIGDKLTSTKTVMGMFIIAIIQFMCFNTAV